MACPLPIPAPRGPRSIELPLDPAERVPARARRAEPAAGKGRNLTGAGAGFFGVAQAHSSRAPSRVPVAEIRRPAPRPDGSRAAEPGAGAQAPAASAQWPRRRARRPPEAHVHRSAGRCRGVRSAGAAETSRSHRRRIRLRHSVPAANACAARVLGASSRALPEASPAHRARRASAGARLAGAGYEDRDGWSSPYVGSPFFATSSMTSAK
jgi:hypothetical protein